MSDYDEHLIGYCELHNDTDRALFSGLDWQRMADMAGVCIAELQPHQFYSDKYDMRKLINIIRAKQEMEKFHYQGKG